MPTPVSLTRRLYDRLPDSFRRSVALVPFGWRIGRPYRSTLRFLLASDAWSAERLRAYQTERLAALLDAALRDVPYYVERYGRLRGRNPWHVLQNIEPVEKPEIQADPDRFRSRAVPDAATYITGTGGTSGRPLRIVLDRSGFGVEWAFMVAQWMRVGFRPGMRRATFRGMAMPGGLMWRDNPVYDERQFSAFAMSSDHLPLYVQAIKTYRPMFLYGYPSALTILARFLETHPDPEFPRVTALLCGSENIREGQRELLERVFRARFFSWYGLSEKVILAGECEGDTSYHAFPQYGVTEVRHERGDVSQAPGSTGELVGTGFLNRAMPLIRYRTGDKATLLGDRCPACGRSCLLLGPVAGRWVQEMLVGRSGARISLTALNMHGEIFSGIERFMLHQAEAGRVTLQVVPAGELAEAARGRILGALRAKTGDEISWQLQCVATLPLTPRGKGVFLVQDIPDAESL